MSLVSNCILTFKILEDAESRMEEVSRFFESERSFVSIHDEKLPRKWYGGSKFMERPLYLGAFNYLNVHKFLDHLKLKVKWRYPEEVQLIIKQQDDNGFSILTIPRSSNLEGFLK